MHKSLSPLIQVLLTTFLFSILAFTASNALGKDWWNIEIKNNRIEAEIVKTETEQRMGLGNRFSLPDGQGMLFLYDEPGIRVFWMKRMNFPIDIVWFLERKAVLIEENIPFPSRTMTDSNLERYGSGVHADMVLELPAGYVKRNRIALGDRIVIPGKE